MLSHVIVFHCVVATVICWVLGRKNALYIALCIFIYLDYRHPHCVKYLYLYGNNNEVIHWTLCCTRFYSVYSTNFMKRWIVTRIMFQEQRIITVKYIMIIYMIPIAAVEQGFRIYIIIYIRNWNVIIELAKLEINGLI